MPWQQQPDPSPLPVGGSFQASPLEADLSITEARWPGVGACLIGVRFGYGPAYAGFWLALFALHPDAQEFAAIVDGGAALLTAVAGYLMVARLLLPQQSARRLSHRSQAAHPCAVSRQSNGRV